MKTRFSLSILSCAFAILFLSSCATSTSTVEVPQGGQLSVDKAYLAGVFDYRVEYSVLQTSFNPDSPTLHLRGDNKEWVSLEFPSGYSGMKRPSGVMLVVVEVPPGNYRGEDVSIIEDFFPRKIMQIPQALFDPITVEPGSITYLGNFLIVRRRASVLGGIIFESEYEYNFEQFHGWLKRDYTVPENIKIVRL